MRVEPIAFSVIIPLYNKQQTISSTIQSVINQTESNFEIIVVNDGSTDGSLQEVQKIDDSRIVIIDKPNGGVSRARNIGIEQSTNPWICFLDADDYWGDNHLASFVSVIEKEEHQDFLATGFRIANSKLETTRTILWSNRGLYNYFEVASLNGFAVHTSSVCLYRKLLQQDTFDEKLSLGEDNELFSRIGRKHLVYFIPLATTYYISDSENKETRKSHPFEKDFLYRIDFRQVTTDLERKYYMLFIVSHLLRFAIIEKNGIKTKRLYHAYRKDLKVKDFIYYVYRKFSK